MDRWNELALNVFVKDYKGFDFAKDFPSAYRSVLRLHHIVVRRLNDYWYEGGMLRSPSALILLRCLPKELLSWRLNV